SRVGTMDEEGILKGSRTKERITNTNKNTPNSEREKSTIQGSFAPGLRFDRHQKRSSNKTIPMPNTTQTNTKGKLISIVIMPSYQPLIPPGKPPGGFPRCPPASYAFCPLSVSPTTFSCAWHRHHNTWP